jgi:outer membrane biosynthesis protein TonB
MPIPDDEMLSPGLKRRLKAVLDEVVPPSPALASARYRMGVAKRRSRAWRFAPALAVIAAAGAALTATAATGSPNPSVWRDRAGTVLQSVSHLPGPSPKAVKSPKPEPRESPTGQGTEPAHPTPSSGHELPPRPTPEPTDKPEPGSSPDPSHEHPGPSPSGDPQGHPDSTPSPTGQPTD